MNFVFAGSAQQGTDLVREMHIPPGWRLVLRPENLDGYEIFDNDTVYTTADYPDSPHYAELRQSFHDARRHENRPVAVSEPLPTYGFTLTATVSVVIDIESDDKLEAMLLALTMAPHIALTDTDAVNTVAVGNWYCIEEESE